MNIERHIAQDAIVSAIASCILSALFSLLVFHDAVTIPFFGTDGLVIDTAPQSFMIAFMGAVVPGLLARRALQASRRPWVSSIDVTRILAQAGLAAISASACGVVLFAVVGLAWSAPLSFGTAMTAKIVYGTVLGWLFTRWSLNRILGIGAGR